MAIFRRVLLACALAMPAAGWPGEVPKDIRPVVPTAVVRVPRGIGRRGLAAALSLPAGSRMLQSLRAEAAKVGGAKSVILKRGKEGAVVFGGTGASMVRADGTARTMALTSELADKVRAHLQNGEAGLAYQVLADSFDGAKRQTNSQAPKQAVADQAPGRAKDPKAAPEPPDEEARRRRMVRRRIACATLALPTVDIGAHLLFPNLVLADALAAFALVFMGVAAIVSVGRDADKPGESDLWGGPDSVVGAGFGIMIGVSIGCGIAHFVGGLIDVTAGAEYHALQAIFHSLPARAFTWPPM